MSCDAFAIIYQHPQSWARFLVVLLSKPRVEVPEESKILILHPEGKKGVNILNRRDDVRKAPQKEPTLT